ncbi:MAG: RluA family pseudouridine synthase [Alphaproteobacteria bacterium]|nr:RluA family pseudouridine synthase [Alphaproteobacteria bacterium]
MTTSLLTLSVAPAQAGLRLDKALVDAQTEDRGLSRARLQHLIKTGQVTLKGLSIKDPNMKVKEGDVYQIVLPPPEPATPEAQALPLSIVYEDDDLLLVDKPAGLVVHPAAGNRDHTLVNALLAHCGDSLSGIGGVARPGIVHRLDKDTSGLMVVAKNDAAHQALTRQFSDRSLSRVYQALVWGTPSPLTGDIEGAIGRHPRARQKMAVVTRGGKEALTHYRVVEFFGTLACLVECKLATGRTHQIRVHMAHIRHPVVGDPLYGKRVGGLGGKGGLVAKLGAFHRQALHAAEIQFKHPRTGKLLHFKTKLPKDMAALLKEARRNTM